MRRPCELILTAPTNCDAEGLVHDLIEKRLCAAGHRDTIATTYRWRGEIHSDTETRIVLHTCTDRISDVETEIIKWHPYEIPYIAHRDLHTSAAYAQWVREQTT